MQSCLYFQLAMHIVATDHVIISFSDPAAPLSVCCCDFAAGCRASGAAAAAAAADPNCSCTDTE